MRPQIESVTPEGVRSGLARVRASLAHVEHDVQVVAAVKYVDAQACRVLVEAGVEDLAENRLDALVAKQDSGVVPPSARWHFIGRLQSREAAAVSARVQLVHALCSESAARRLGALAAPSDCLVQVNVAGDPAKDGLEPGAVEAFLLGLPASIHVRGFMTMPAFAERPEASRPAFAALRELRDTLAPRLTGRHDLRLLSMGTSQDYVVAAEEGATHVRLGRILHEGTE